VNNRVVAGTNRVIPQLEHAEYHISMQMWLLNSQCYTKQMTLSAIVVERLDS